jgi:hypothetical protein
MAKYFSKTAAGLDESGLGARGAAAPSRGNASGEGSSRGKSSKRGQTGATQAEELPVEVQGICKSPLPEAPMPR